MRILLADSNHEVLHDTLNRAGFACDCYWDKSPDELKQLLPAYDILILRSKFKVDRALLDTAPGLKAIGRIGAGMENIDLDYAGQRGVLCLSVPEGNRDAVGEQAIGMLLMLLNNLKKADAEVRRGIWIRAGNRGREIMGKRVGLIGFGNTGQAFARKLSGFECEILVHDKYLNTLPLPFVRSCSLRELQAECDIVSLHLPLNAETKHYANKSFFEGFRKAIYFINTARGACTKTSDLVEALKSGKVLGACLDVFEEESISFESAPENRSPEFEYLLQSDKVILSPHIAGWTHESNYKMSLGMANKIIKAFPLNC